MQRRARAGDRRSIRSTITAAMVRDDARDVCGQRRADEHALRGHLRRHLRARDLQLLEARFSAWRLDSRRPSPTKRTCGGPEGRGLSVRLEDTRPPRGARTPTSGTAGRARGARWKKRRAAVGGTPADVPAPSHSDRRRCRCAPSRSITRGRLRPLAALGARPTARRRPSTAPCGASARRRARRAIAQTAQRAG